MRGTHRGRDRHRATAPDRDRRRPGGRERGRRRARPLRLRTWPGPARRRRARPPLASRGLAAQAGGALGWSFTNSVLTKVCTVGVGVLLARLLGPHSFGTFAVASVALTIMSNFNDLGVSLAIVRWPGEPREIAPTVTTISVVTSAVLYGGCYLGAPAYAAAMGAPSATNVVRTLSLVIVIDGFATAPIGFLQRYFRQDQRTVADQANIWLGTSVTVALALAGLGPMSLALGRIAGCLTSVILLVRFSPQPLRFGFNRREVRGLLRFGLPLAGSGVVAFAIANVDQLVVGRVLGVTALGYFVLAANLSNWPSAAFSEPIGQVAPTALARLQHDPPAMRSSFETMAALVSAVTLPVCLVEAGCAAPLIRIVYGTRWLPADQPLTWLAMLAALQIFFQLTFDYFVVLAKSRVILALQTVWAVVLLPGLVAGARLHGIAGVALAELVVAAIVPLPWYLFELHKVGTGGRALATRLGLPLLGAAVAGLAAAELSATVRSGIIALCCGALVGVLVIGLLLLRMRSVLASLARRYVGRASRNQRGEPGKSGEPDAARREASGGTRAESVAGFGDAPTPGPILAGAAAPSDDRQNAVATEGSDISE